MIRCTCLIQLNETKDKLLLVRVRNNEKWYFPGGKIEENESMENSLIRELKEELNVNLIPSSIKFRVSVVGRAYGIDDTVELNCYTASFKEEIKPCSEISEVAYIDWVSNKHLLAPALIEFCNKYLNYNYHLL